MNETRTLAEFVADLRYEDLPQPVVDQACRIVVDTVGCAISAWAEDPAKSHIALEVAKLYARDDGASVIGSAGVKSQPAFAALANGILANAADNDDTHKRALLHTGSVVVPPALALAQTGRLTGRDLIVALVAGYEVAVRVGMAVMPTHYRYWHSTATNGTFGAAATAAKALKLDVDGVHRALGLAGTQAAGLNTFFESGDMTKSIHPGKAAFNGILSAQLAQLGATSPPAILEHPKGYLNAFSTEPKPQKLVEGLDGVEEALRRRGLEGDSPRPGREAVAFGREGGVSPEKHAIDPAQIARITNETYNTVKSHFSNKDVSTVMAARVSVPYCIAIAAIDGRLTQAQFSPARINDPLLRAVLAHTEVIADAELNKLYPDKFPARVTITLKNGASFQETVLFPKGDPQDPLSADELDVKFRENVAAMFSPARADKLLHAIYTLSDARNVDGMSVLLHG